MEYFDPQSLKGVYSATFTPYDKENNINVAMIEKIVEFHLKAGLTGFYLTGSTGESFLLSEEERKLVIESVVKFNKGRGKVIAHVGHISTDVAIRLAQYAEKCGADALSAVGPIFFGQTLEGMFRHYEAIANATDLPFLIYWVDNISGTINPEAYVKFFDIKNVIGMKYTGTNFFAMQQLSNMIEKPHVFFSGSDEHFVGALSFGVSGSIGSSQNFAPKHFMKIYNLYNEGKIAEAKEVQEELNRIVYLMVSQENFSYRKAFMRYIGLDCGPFRKPYKALTEKEYSDFAKKLDEMSIQLGI